MAMMNGHIKGLMSMLKRGGANDYKYALKCCLAVHLML